MTTIDGRQPIRKVWEADLVVVGTGPSGMSVVRELAPTGQRIVILDAGDFTVPQSLQDTLRGDAASEAVEPQSKIRQKRVGGASMQWGGRTAPFEAFDFEAREALGLPGWPVTRQELDDYYRRAAVRLDVGAFEWTAQGAIKGERRHLVEPADEAIADEGIWRYSPPTRFADVYKKEIEERENVTLIVNANVVRFTSANGDDVDGVEAMTAAGERITVKAKSYVLAAGGLESTRILLHSGLGNEHGQVGRNYMIHPIAEVGVLELRDVDDARAATNYVRTVDGAWARRLIQLAPEVKREHNLLNLGLAIWYEDPRDPSHGDPLLSAFALVRKALTYTGEFKATGMHRRYADLQSPVRHVKNVVLGAPSLVKYAGVWARDRWISSRTLPAFTRRSTRGRYRLRFDAEQLPTPDNRVVLSASEKDRFGVPRLSVQHRVTREDRLNYLTSLRLLAEAFERSGWARYTPPTEKEMLEISLVDGTHQMGLLRMGSEPTTSVVDRNLKVWGLSNLYVASTAVFPTASHAGPTMTAVALAIRLADHLRSQQLDGL
ncbi:GMC family oxidoreductase [Falsarthrobacter nasiphocae]|uniref:Choline dehydrogenase-like flavoprotein n=1 Tax=Falsarthrobacter nasiphocae TaxID=189863 RepID=A0AAE4C7N1_9MICC|nr:GMC family oxidoreductase [Falsarthrobacter nasiphocae]MDR6891595.1 choline dehydrogenase-like flavoprotein [Falsarthrobacter nasiphocae]